MKIYVITKGCYSNYRICAVATDPEKAERLAEIYSDSWDTAEVEEFDTDKTVDLLEGRFPFSVYFYPSGAPSVFDEKRNEAFKVGIRALGNSRFPNASDMVVTLHAPDEATALKIACDMRAKYLAEKAGI